MSFMLAFKRLIPAALLAAVVAAPAPLWAQDVFIRPNTSNSTGPTVDYGVKARPQAQPAPSVVAPPVQPQPVTPSPVQNPVPQVQAPAPVPQQFPQASNTNSKNGISVEKYGPGVSVVKLPVDKPPPPGKGAYTLYLNFKGGAIGTQDKESVMSQLGITESDIQANCFLRYTAILNFGGGDAAILNSLSSPSVQYKFTAPMEKMSLYPSVVCRKLHPPVSGMTLEQGGYYIAGLSSVTCEPGAKGNTSFTADFTFTGNGTGQCVYR